MPAAFTRCQRRGGRIKRLKPRPDVYINVCYPPGGGSAVHGEVHHIKEGGSESEKKE